MLSACRAVTNVTYRNLFDDTIISAVFESSRCSVHQEGYPIVIDHIFSASILVHLALLFHAAGFLTRDELWLRALVLMGTLFYICYYYYISAEPLWDAMFASGVLALINMALIAIIVRERTVLAMSSHEAGLYSIFNTLTPGQFRKLLRNGHWRTAAKPEVLTEIGKPVNRLYYIVSGEIDLEKETGVGRIGGEIFIGEIAFVLGTNASATVTTRPGTVYIEWDVVDIRRLMNRSPAFKNAMIALFNTDMARKVAISNNDQNRDLMDSAIGATAAANPGSV